MPQISLRSTLPGLVVFLFLVLLFPGLFSSLLPRFSGFLPGLGSLLWIKRLNSGRLNDRLWCRSRCRGQWRDRSSTDVDVYGGALLDLGPLCGVRVDHHVRRYRVARGRDTLAEYEASIGEVGLGCYRPVEVGYLHTSSRAGLIFGAARSRRVEALEEAQSIEKAAEQDQAKEKRDQGGTGPTPGSSASWCSGGRRDGRTYGSLRRSSLRDSGERW